MNMSAEHRTFDDELKELNKSILEMGALVEVAINNSIESLKRKDEDMAKNVIRGDDKINKLEVEIDERCVNLLALRQPMAVDLRFITTGMRIATDIERIGDLAVDIAERSLEMMSQPLPKPLIDIPKLGLVAQKMVKGALDSFVNRDLNIAREVWNTDDEADHYRDLIQDELIDVMMHDQSVIPQSVLLIFVARHLERICDHATNIAEDVVYMVEAKMIKHNVDELKKFIGKDWKEKKKI
jgi:phosphate transport system protein